MAEPKSKKGRRTVCLTSGTVAALRGHLERQMREMDRPGSLYETGSIANPKIVSEMLGHSNIAITLGTYLRVLPDV